MVGQAIAANLVVRRWVISNILTDNTKAMALRMLLKAQEAKVMMV
jgi:hypothetical protein